MEGRPNQQWPILSWNDALGPAKVVFLNDCRRRLKAIVVLDNLALGPAIGGVRVLPDVTPEEIFRLARAMTLKNAVTRPDTPDQKSATRLQTRLVVQGANIPATSEAERILHERGILVIPDFIANAGGIICCSVEYAGGNEDKAFAVISETIRKNTHSLLRAVDCNSLLPREAAMRQALERLRQGRSRSKGSVAPRSTEFVARA